MIVFDHRRQLAVVALLGLLFGLSSCDSGSDDQQPATIAVDSGAAASSEPQTDTQESTGREVVVETLPYAEIDEQLVYGYFAFPADMVEPIPAIILIHDRWGLDERIRDLSKRFAAEGYIVLAVDFFEGEVADSPSSARALEIKVFENPQPPAEILRQAYQFLKDTFGAPRVASIGYGFGGGWSLSAAMLLPEELSASVIYYGQVIDDERKLAAIQAPILGLFAANDRVITAESVLDFEAALQRLEKDFEIEIFAGTERAFADERSANYNSETAGLAWQQTLDFLNRHLGADTN